ncbi:MAG: ASKHA domain-containing protein [Kiritimatiellaeota bacterium]|nr:ASKHA domain-containing protein [Kiritimatiellota bacterium]
MPLHIQLDRRRKSIAVDSRPTLAQLLEKAGIHLNLRCGGEGICGGCRVQLTAGTFRTDGQTLTLPAGSQHDAFACQTHVVSADAGILIPAASLLETGGQIVSDFHAPNANSTQAVSATAPLAAAVDIGTTTVALVLLDPATGHILARASQYNQQIRKADDVASRISFCRTEAEVRVMQELVIQQTINPLLAEACATAGVQTGRVERLAVAGNTVMEHLFLGLPVESIGRLPFNAVRHIHPPCEAGSLGLAMHSRGRVDVVPSVAGYIGGDIIADIHAAHLLPRGGESVLVDIGTNSEVVYALGGRLLTCATAAGPAFEGAGLLHGRRASPGAIEHVRCDAKLDFQYDVIGSGKADGICGSGIIDFLAVGFRCGLINAHGRFDVERLKNAGRYVISPLARGSSHACVLVSANASANGQAVVVTERDIEQVLKAKAATYAGLKTLLTLQGRSVRDIPRFVLAGGFARHLDLTNADLTNAIALGLLPDLPLDRFEVLGNGSLAGAYLALTDAAALPAMEKISHQPQVIELNRTPDFEDNFIDALLIPNLNTEEFPSVNTLS